MNAAAASNAPSRNGSRCRVTDGHQRRTRGPRHSERHVEANCDTAVLAKQSEWSTVPASGVEHDVTVANMDLFDRPAVEVQFGLGTRDLPKPLASAQVPIIRVLAHQSLFVGQVGAHECQPGRSDHPKCRLGACDRGRPRRLTRRACTLADLHLSASACAVLHRSQCSAAQRSCTVQVLGARLRSNSQSPVLTTSRTLLACSASSEGRPRSPRSSAPAPPIDRSDARSAA